MKLIPLFLIGCTTPTLGDFDTDAVPTAPSYSAHIVPILAEHCARCHDGTDLLHQGGIGLNTYRRVRGARVRITCTAVSPTLVAEFADLLLPLGGSGSTTPCDSWSVYSMPPGAAPRLTLQEQYILAQWVATGAQP